MGADGLSLLPEDLIRLARDLYGQWRLNEAYIVLETLLESPEKHEVAALNLRADISWSLGDVDGARENTLKVLTISPLDHQAARRARWLELPVDPARYTPKWILSFLSSGRRPAGNYLPMVKLLNQEGHHGLALEVATIGLDLLKRRRGSLLQASVKNDGLINRLILGTAIAKEHLGDYHGALSSLAEIDPATPIAKEAALNRSRILFEIGRFDEAEAALSPYYDDVVPAFNGPRYHILLSKGKIKEAFALYRTRKETEVFRRLISNYRSPTSFLAGTWKDDRILILAEGGPGDEVRMSSLYGDILANAGHVSISCDPRLKTLLARTYPEVQFIPSPRFRDEFRRSDYFDRNEVRDALGAKLLTNSLLRESDNVTYTASVFEFLVELRSNRDAFKSPFRRNLRVDPDLASKFSNKMSPGTRRVGLAWRSIVNTSIRQKHYFCPEDFHLLIHLQDTEFWVLQPGCTDDELKKLSKFLNLRVPQDIDLVDDFESQAALISCLDAVISPCTTTAELAGAVGVKTLILANTYMTAWRQNQDFSDIWHPNGELILGDLVGDRCTLIKNTVDALVGKQRRPNLGCPPAFFQENIKYHTVKVLKKNNMTRYSLSYRIKKFIALVPGLRKLKRNILHYFSTGRASREKACAGNSIEVLAKQLVRQKEIKEDHIAQADGAISIDKTDTMLAVKAALQARSGRFQDALATIAQLPAKSLVHERILPALRTDMADLGRHDLSQEGLRLLLLASSNDPGESSVRLGNAKFENDAYEFLSKIVQPESPKGYVILFGLNNRVTLGLMTPIALQLAKDGYYVCSSVAASMKPSNLPQLKGISGAIRWSGLSLTDEAANHRKLRNDWHVDLEDRSVICDGINYFTFFAERLGKMSNSYDVDISNSKVLADFESLLQRSDVALTVCKRILSLADEGKPIRLAAMDTHFAPAGIVRKWCEEFGRWRGIELVALSISYENYYSNLTSLEATTISVENLTAHPDVRHPLFGGRKRFEKYIAENPQVLNNKSEVLTHILMNRSKTEQADPEFRSYVISRSKQCRERGGKVCLALGKVLIDFAAPYDHGHAFNEFSDWIRFLATEIAHTSNLLIIKPHPHEKRTEIAVSGVQTLRDLLPATLPENVIFLDHAAFNSHELADLVDLTFVWNGTAYAEFPVLGKPVVAESIWAEKDYPLNGISLDSKDDYLQVLRGERTVSLSDDTVGRATAFLQFMKSPEVSIPFGYVKRAGTNKSIGSVSFIKSDMAELEGRSDCNLAMIASRFFTKVAAGS